MCTYGQEIMSYNVLHKQQCLITWMFVRTHTLTLQGTLLPPLPVKKAHYSPEAPRVVRDAQQD